MKEITELIHSLGIRATYIGYQYLRYALLLCLKDENYILFVWKWLYGDVAKHFGKTRSSVERALRTVVTACWNYGNRDLLHNIAGYHLEQCPAVGEFIAILYHHLEKSTNKI
ncbi:sporulation initiation factor Spo0A C-terminal domain-containing protein [Ruminococcus sp. OA3]|uniref:sporulation initiation factor Spo0A C-terminal domain-containing protein n=1 Tax=Ruminococcus sp. OA3 TaxID=2914164 RepID=UPI001F06DF08|nr:sporulation initiation factor Spo0A C-terminal domain-containing protein [Ruminococcus sp. OA3]MCH1983948.1 sporulation initiation factor Spo0A C-terminal domain-containing protein [Ruminococcus sp. OA3]